MRSQHASLSSLIPAVGISGQSRKSGMPCKLRNGPWLCSHMSLLAPLGRELQDAVLPACHCDKNASFQVVNATTGARTLAKRGMSVCCSWLSFPVGAPFLPCLSLAQQGIPWMPVFVWVDAGSGSLMAC